MDQSPAPEASPSELVFDADLRPHRSLSPRGFVILMAAVAGVSFVGGMVYLLLGAWPVFVFLGLDVLLLWWAFRLNFRSAKTVETLRLSTDALIVRRVTPNGTAQEWRFQPYWLRVRLEQPTPEESRLVLTSHGRSLPIGTFLSTEERVELAGALKDALARIKTSVEPSPNATAVE
jgi:uncharacterized membrane protein